MSSAAYFTPSAFSAPEVRMEKPHAGCCGVPFMKSITLVLLDGVLDEALISSFVIVRLRPGKVFLS